MDSAQAEVGVRRLKQEAQKAATTAMPPESDQAYRRRANAYLRQLEAAEDAYQASKGAKREGIGRQAAMEIAAEETQRAATRVQRQQDRVTRGMTRMAQTGAYAFVPALTAMTTATGAMTTQGQRAVTSIMRVNSSLAALQSAGIAMGGRTGAGMMAVGVAGAIATALAMSIAGLIDSHTANVEKDADAKASEVAEQSARRQAAEVRKQAERDVRAARQGTMGVPGGGAWDYAAKIRAEADKEAQWYEGKAGRIARSREIQDAGRQARATAEALRRANLTPQESAQEQAAELRKSAADLRASAAELSVLEKGSKQAASMMVQANDLEKRANALLEKIESNTKSWSDMALEVLGGGARTARPLSLSEMQGRRSVTLNFTGVGDEISSALARRFGPMIWDAMQSYGVVGP